MKRSCIHIVAVLCGLLLGSAAGRPALAEVVEADAITRAAVQHSYARRTSASAVDAAAARQDQADARGLPTLDVGARANRYSGLEPSNLGPGVSIPELDERYTAFATVVQPLYAGGRIRGQQDVEAFTHAAATSTYTAVTAAVALDALNAYWSWSRAFHFVVAAQATVERMQSLYDDAKHQHDAGLVTENDLLSTEVELERARLRLEDARRALDLAKAQIAFLTGTPLAADATPRAAPSPEAAGLPAEDDLIVVAYSNRAERVARAADVAAASARLRVSQADRRPSVSVRAGYEYANPNQLFFPPDDQWNDDAYAGVDVAWNVWDSGLTRGRVAEAAAQRDQAEWALQRTDEEIALQVRQTRIRLQEAINRYVVSVRAQASARRNLESATSLRDGGLARQSDVLDASDRLAEADDAVVAAAADAAAGQAALAFACGTLRVAEEAP